MNKPIYGYYINLDERGDFYADVRDKDGRSIYEIKAGNSLGEDETSIFEDGYMRDRYDVAGLTVYLRELDTIPADAEVLAMMEFEKRCDEIRGEERYVIVSSEGQYAAEDGKAEMRLTDYPEHARVWLDQDAAEEAAASYNTDRIVFDALAVRTLEWGSKTGQFAVVVAESEEAPAPSSATLGSLGR